jgi:sulfide dehydrogenase cytochrome subunit
MLACGVLIENAGIAMKHAGRYGITTALAALLFCLAQSACAQVEQIEQIEPERSQQALYLKSLAATCANCHGTYGKAVEGSSIGSLAGLDRAYVMAQMKAFKAGTRPATVMQQISKGFSDAQIESLAGFFAAQKH